LGKECILWKDFVSTSSSGKAYCSPAMLLTVDAVHHIALTLFLKSIYN